VIRRLLALDGVVAVSQFRDDGSFVEGYGLLPEHEIEALAHFAHDYKRIVQGNADQLAMFTRVKGWTPPRGWIVGGVGMGVCSVGNLVCIFDQHEGDLGEILRQLSEAASY
jgi:roadblock/LC7 domain-containing protein